LGFGVGVWGLGYGELAPIPNPQSPIPNPQSPSKIKSKILLNNYCLINLDKIH